MPKVQEIKIINVDNVEYAVDAMSDTCKQLVAIFNEWNQKESDAKGELALVQAAKETLSRQIINQIRNEQAEAQAASEAPAAEGTVVDQTTAGE